MPAGKLAPLHVALLRGINVSGKNTLPMAELASIFVDAGCEDVRTYIQSGNVVFRAKSSVARRVPEMVAGAIAEGFGYEDLRLIGGGIGIHWPQLDEDLSIRGLLFPHPGDAQRVG